MRLLAAAVVLAIQAAGSSGGPPLPYVDEGACPFECCTYREWTAETKLTAYESHDPKSRGRVVFTLAPGERVTALTGIVRTTVAGEVKVTARTRVDETLTFEPGDRVFLLAPVGEGFMNGWYRGRVLEEFDATMFGRPEDCAKWQKCTGTIERRPEIDWWVRVRNTKGQSGWVLMPRDKPAFNGPDACGG